MHSKLSRRNLKRAALATLLAGLTAPSVLAEPASIGDLPGYDADGYFAESESDLGVPANDIDPSIRPTGSTIIGGGEIVASDGYNAPVQGSVMPAAPMASGSMATSPLPPTSYPTIDAGSMSGPVYVDGGHESFAVGCDAACDSACESDHGCNWWIGGEALLWFVGDRDAPSLLVQSDEGTVPVPGQPGFQSIFGGSIADDLLPGFRVDGGVYVTENIGLGGRYWQLFNGDSTFDYEGFGSGATVGRPFFNTDLGVDDAFLINTDIDLDGGATQQFAGTFIAESEFDVWAAEAYGRVRLSGTKDHALDLIGGYTHLELDNSLVVGSGTVTIDDGIGGSAVGTQRTFLDAVATRNEFDGGQVGFEAVLTRGRWLARSLTKVHLGNMETQVASMGMSSENIPGFGATDDGDGFFQQLPTGTFERDEFTFIPELNFKLGYAIRPGMYVTAGYSFLFFDEVALADGAYNAIASGTSFFDGVDSDGSLASLDSLVESFYLHGVDVGLTIAF